MENINKTEEDSKNKSQQIQPKQAQPGIIEVGKIHEMGRVSLQIDTYDDIFSDFDPRPFSERTLSDDFLLESKKAFREKESGRLELRFLIPEKERYAEFEAIIIKRLKDHFKKHYQLQRKEFEKSRKNAIYFIISGFILMLISSFIDFYQTQKFIYSFLITIFEPTGWFFVWYGMDYIFYKMKDERVTLEFYQKMVRTEITFLPYQ